MIKMDIFLHKNPQAHLLYIFIYSLVVSFFSKAASAWRSHS